MRLQSAVGALLGICGAHAFRDTSPFMYFSTSDHALTSPQITTSSSLLSAIDSQLLASSSKSSSQCPAHTYIIAVQPGVSASDLEANGAATTLRSWLSGRDITFKSTHSVAQVVMDKGQQDLVKLISNRCSRQPKRVGINDALVWNLPYSKDHPRLLVIDLPKLPAGASRSAAIRENDLQLADAIKQLSKKDYTVFYTTSPPSPSDEASAHEPTPYEMDDSQSPLHFELRRDLNAHERADDVTLPDGPLFERYQYLTPGLFMGLLAVLFLFTIGYAGVSALAGLQVSYAAFDKENGPQGQKSKAQ